jgi:hypothetical protein
MSVRHAVIAMSFAALVASAATPALAQSDPILDGIASLPGSVEDVRIVGSWNQGSQSGVYRVLVSRSGGDLVTARMFVQWIVYDDNGGAQVTSTVEIQELAQLGVDVVDFSGSSDGGPLTVNIQTLDPNGNADKNYVLTVNSPTQHTLAPASN